MRKTGQKPPYTTRPEAQPSSDSRTRAEQQRYHVQFSEALTLPATDRFLRINQVLKIFPVAKSTWWLGVKKGIYPKGVKLSERTTAWRESEIQALIERLSSEARGAS